MRCIPALLELQGQGSWGVSRVGGGNAQFHRLGAPGCHQGFEWSNAILPDTF